MSLNSLEPLMSELPIPGDAGRRLLRFLDDQRKQGAFSRRFSTSRMFEIAEDLSKSDVASLLAWFVSKGVLDQIVRVESPALGGIGDFASIEEVPEVIEDWRQGNVKFHVQPENLSVLYKLHE